MNLKELRKRNVSIRTKSDKYFLRFNFKGIILIINSSLIFILNFELKIKLIGRILKKMIQYNILILFDHRILAYNKCREQPQIFCCQGTLLSLISFMEEIVD